ncbi:hypothetical protein GIB67_020685 [Kingdonia uniflora]|uniref:MLO-like protein n=1 Tax=Kingdonia uniflora TaxID=39325 RepID=A0A7J7NJH9_9MAGN|nr:hypothetical protein GIB67_020685 [Kingdonia uniflora]
MALYEALKKVKGEQMVLSFISLLLTFGQNYIARICIPLKAIDTMLSCLFRRNLEAETTMGRDHGVDRITTHEPDYDPIEHHRRILWNQRRFLFAGSDTTKCKAGYEPLISLNGLHQLHIFIFFIAIFHVIYNALMMLLRIVKIHGWKVWQQETIARDYGRSRFRITHEMPFMKSYTNLWGPNWDPFIILCCLLLSAIFQVCSEGRLLNHTSQIHHCSFSPRKKVNFQKYIKRSLEDDFKFIFASSRSVTGGMGKVGNEDIGMDLDRLEQHCGSLLFLRWKRVKEFEERPVRWLKRKTAKWLGKGSRSSASNNHVTTINTTYLLKVPHLFLFKMGKVQALDSFISSVYNRSVISNEEISVLIERAKVAK